MNDHFLKVAVLIDADNIPSTHIEEAMDYIKNLGEPFIKRIYGNWSKSYLTSWQEHIIKYGFVAIQQFDYIPGKNASDMAISVDAMELLFNKQIDVFCLLSSDSDFTPLCLKLKEHGKKVVGMGNQNASKALVNACHEFKFFVKHSPPPVVVKPAYVAPVPKYAADPNHDKALIETIKNLIKTKGVNGRLNIAVLGVEISQNRLDISRYKGEKLADILKTLKAFSVTKEDGGAYVELAKATIVPTPHLAVGSTKMLDKTSEEAIQKDITLINAISNLILTHKNARNIAELATVGHNLAITYGITPAQYGYGSFADIVRNLPMFVLKRIGNEEFVYDKRLMDDMSPLSPSPKPENTNKHLSSGLKNAQAIIDAITDIIIEHQDGTGWTMLSTVGQCLRDVGIKAKDYGYKNMGLLIKTLGRYDTKVIGTTSYIKDPTIKVKPTKKTDKPADKINTNTASLDTANFDTVSVDTANFDSATLELASLNTKNTDTKNNDTKITDTKNTASTSGTISDTTKGGTQIAFDVSISGADDTFLDAKNSTKTHIAHKDTDTQDAVYNKNIANNKDVTDNKDIADKQNIANQIDYDNRNQAIDVDDINAKIKSGTDTNSDDDNDNNSDGDSLIDDIDGVIDDELIDEVIATLGADKDSNQTINDEEETSTVDLLLGHINNAIIANQNADGYTKLSDISKAARAFLGCGPQAMGYKTFADMLILLPQYEVVRRGRATFVKLLA